MKKRTTVKPVKAAAPVVAYGGLISGIGKLLETARHSAARVVNSLMTATYWEVGRRIVEFEQGGKKRAGYGEELLGRLAEDLTARFGKGFGADNLGNMRRFFLAFPPPAISETLSRKLVPSPEIASTVSRQLLGSAVSDEARPEIGAAVSLEFTLVEVAKAMPLP